MKCAQLLFVAFWCFIFTSQAQTTTTTVNADWTNNADWTGTSPDYDTNQSATIAHNTTISGNPISINNGHTLIINAGVLLITDETITIKEGGTLIINGEIRGTDGGKEFKIEKGTLTVNAGGVFDWNGDWTSDDDPATITINGDVTVGGDMSNKVTIDGGGALNVDGDLNNDGGSIFGCTLTGDRCCTGTGCALPVELVYFNGTYNNGLVYLAWKTATELNNDFFSVERLDNNEWVSIGHIQGAGTISIEKSYQFVDTKPPHGQVYYRLKQTDFDGTFAYSPIVSVLSKSGDFSFSYYPNPVIDKFTIEYHGFHYQEISLQNKSGQKVDVPIIEKPGKIEFDLSEVARGIYIIYVKNDQHVQRIKLIVN